MPLLSATIFLSTVTLAKEQLLEVARILSSLTPSSGEAFMKACKALDYATANDLLCVAFKKLTNEDFELQGINNLVSRLSECFPDLENRVTASFTESDKILAIDEEFDAIRDKLKLSELLQLSQLIVHELIDNCAGCLKSKASDWMNTHFQKNSYSQCIALLYGLLKKISYIDLACSIYHCIYGFNSSELTNNFNQFKWELFRPRDSVDKYCYETLCDNSEMNAMTVCISFLVLYRINKQKIELTSSTHVEDVLPSNTFILLELIHALASVYRRTDSCLSA